MLWPPTAGVCIAEPATASVIAGVWGASGADIAPNVIAWGCIDAGTGFADVCMGSLGTLGMIKPEA